MFDRLFTRTDPNMYFDPTKLALGEWALNADTGKLTVGVMAREWDKNSRSWKSTVKSEEFDYRGGFIPFNGRMPPVVPTAADLSGYKGRSGELYGVLDTNWLWYFADSGESIAHRPVNAAVYYKLHGVAAKRNATCSEPIPASANDSSAG